MDNVQLFLDYANIEATAKSLGYKIDYGVLLNEKLVSQEEGRILTGAFAYVPRDPRNEYKNQREIEGLWNSGFYVVTKIGTIAGSSFKCDFDIEISMDIMRIAHTNRPDIIVLVSGDSDFIPLVKELRTMGIRVEVASFESNLSRHLKQVASGVINLNEYLNEDINDVIQDENYLYGNNRNENILDDENELEPEDREDEVVEQRAPKSKINLIVDEFNSNRIDEDVIAKKENWLSKILNIF